MSFASRVWPIWRRAIALAAPVSVEAVLRTSMRTTDVLVAGVLSPAAVAAVGIGDSFSRIVNRTGGGLGDATIALSSQDTGVEAFSNRDEAVAQAFLIGLIFGVPFVAFGLLFSRAAIEVLGAELAVVRLGGQYLGLIMMAAPMIHLSRIGSKALQGAGDTVTPMYVRGFGNLLNLVGTVVLAFGLGPFPELSVVGIALATIVGESTTALLFLGVIYRPSGPLAPVRPAQLAITKQLMLLSWPRITEGGTIMIADLPFNAVLLAIGTEANAAYHIGRRVYQQVIAPVRRGFSIAANILVGQSLGNDARDAYVNGGATTALSMLVIVGLSVPLYVGGGPIVGLFSKDPATSRLAIGFVQAFAVGGVFHAGYQGFQGALRGGSDTRTPFFATLAGMFVFLLGISYVGGIYLGFGVLAVYLAIVADFACRTAIVGYAYYRRRWIEYGTTLMVDRGSVEGEGD